MISSYAQWGHNVLKNFTKKFKNLSFNVNIILQTIFSDKVKMLLPN